jgi:hypothetical protein
MDHGHARKSTSNIIDTARHIPTASLQTYCVALGSGQYTGSDLFSDQDDIFLRILIPMVAQVATAPCTDPIQE